LHFVAIEENTVIGCVVLNPLNPEKRKRSSCKWLLKPTNNEGIGKLLVEELLSFANPMELKK
jgi:predicted N-acetyltransferase YhbS